MTRTNGKRCSLNYFDFIDECLEWKEANKVLPCPFDIVMLTTNIKECPGWWTGDEWFGKRLTSNEIVIAWKRVRALCSYY